MAENINEYCDFFADNENFKYLYKDNERNNYELPDDMFVKNDSCVSNAISVKLLTDTAKLPTHGSEFAAGWDLYADIPEVAVIKAHTTTKIPTGIAMAIPNGYFGGIYARSGIATKRGLRPCQGVSVIDSDYRGEIFIPLHNDTDSDAVIEPGERIAQLIIQPYLNSSFAIVEELEETERGAGGFGSSGTK